MKKPQFIDIHILQTVPRATSIEMTRVVQKRHISAESSAQGFQAKRGRRPRAIVSPICWMSSVLVGVRSAQQA